MNEILIEFVYMLNIHEKQNINCQLTKEKLQPEIIQKLLLNNQVLQMIFIKILKITVQIRNKK